MKSIRERLLDSGFPSSRVAKAVSWIFKVLLFPVPLRIGWRLSLIREGQGPRIINLFAAPWLGSTKRVVIHQILDEKDWSFWICNLFQILAAQKAKPSLNMNDKRKRREQLRKVAGGRYGYKMPSLFEAMQILREIKGGFHINMTGADGREHHGYLVFNHLSSQPPHDLLTLDISKPTFDQLQDGRLDFSTAFIQGSVKIHGNPEPVAQLARLSGRPVIPTYKPNVYIDRTDHPLDKGYLLDLPLTPLTASCILKIDSMEQYGADFTFSARGYDVFRTRILNMLHAYDTSPGVSWERLTLRLSWLKPNVFRVRCVRGESVPDNLTPMLAGPLPKPDFKPECIEHPDRYEIRSPELTLLVFRDDFRIEVRGPGGEIATMGARQKDGFPNIVDSLPLGFFHDRETGRSFSVNNFELKPGEAVFGFGEHYDNVNKRGRTVTLWNEEGMGHSTGRNYKNIPFFMSTNGYGVFVNESLPMTFFVGSRFYPRHELAVEGDLLDQFFFFGPSLKRVQGEYTELTGRSPMVPKWSLGLWYSRISYMSRQQVDEVAERIRKEGWPGDVIHIDTGWFDKEWQCDWKFSETRFPDPAGMIKKLHEMNLRISLWQWPYLVEALDLTYEAIRRNALAKGKHILMNSLLYHIDFSRPEGVAFYQEQIGPLLAMGVDAIKTDFGEHVQEHMEFQGGSGRKMKNLYALLYQKAAHEEAKKTGAILWARSAYAGAQRYPVHWSGDSASTFEDMHCALKGGLSLGLSGFTFWSNDVGGFSGNPSDELYARWAGWSAFNSHMRLHGGPVRYREPWNYGEEAQAAFRKVVGLRYRLLPYLYSESVKSARDGLPVMRHLVFEFQEDPTSWNIDDQFMFGESIMVAPILTRQDHRKAWIPPGLWYEGTSGRMIEGPCWIEVQADLATVPIYFRGGHAVALGPEITHTNEKPEGPLTIMVFPDNQGLAAMRMETENGAVSLEMNLDNDTARATISGMQRDYSIEIPRDDVKQVVVNGGALRASSPFTNWKG